MSRKRSALGLSLIELVVFIIVLGVGLAGVLTFYNMTTRSSVDPLIRKQALAIATSLLEEIELRGFTYCDPDDAVVYTATSSAGCATPESIGPEAGEVRSQYDNFRERVPLKGQRVVLKPNLVEYHRDKVINTNPHVVAAVIELCQREGAAEVIVAEGPGHWRNVEYLVAASGLGDVLRHYKVPFIDLNHDEPVKRMNLGRLTKLPYLYLSQTIATADVVISLPKLKTHHWAVATLSLKNLFGTLPGICYGWPKNELHWRGIPNSIVDIALTHTPHLAIVDGIIGMEGDGPLNGTAKPVGVLVMGVDLVAVDATCCRVMGLPPERVPTLMLAQSKRLGNLKAELIPQLGEPVAAVATRFALPPGIDKQLLPDTTPVGA